MLMALKIRRGRIFRVRLFTVTPSVRLVASQFPWVIVPLCCDQILIGSVSLDSVEHTVQYIELHDHSRIIQTVLNYCTHRATKADCC